MLVSNFLRATNHVAPAQVGEVVSECRQGANDVIDVGYALLPLNLLTLSRGKCFEIDQCHTRYLSLSLSYTLEPVP